MKARLLLGPLFLSGAGTLVLEVCWFRRMAQVAGATSIAMAAVLAAVIGGMALGAYVFGRVADRSRRPLRLYAVLEIGIALSALLTPWLLDWSQGAFDLLFRELQDLPALYSFLAFLLAALLLAFPALLMGGTLPAIACAVRTDPERRGRALGLLYGVNTLGAVAGTVAAGFFLLPAFGLAGATRSAAVLSGGAALLAWVLRGPVGVAGREVAVGRADPRVRRAMILYAASGFLGLAAEVAFTRRLVLVLGSTTYAFTTTLAVFLLGIGLGGLVGSALARRRDGHLRLLESIVALTAALLSLACLAVYLLPRLYLTGSVSWGGSFEAELLLRFLLSAAVLLPGTIGLGAAFPLAAHLATAGSMGAGTGRLYAANTLASVAGSTCAVFVLVPLLGPRLAVVAVAVIVAAVAASRRRAVPGLLLLVAALGFVPPPAVARERLLSGVYASPYNWIVDGRINEQAWREGADLPYVEYGRESSVAIRRWCGTHTLLIDGKPVANNEALGVVQHLSLLGHLPMAVHPAPKRVLVVGLGMGTTYSACLKHGPETLRVVELEPAVVRAADWLGVRPKDIVIADARSYLRSTEERFDVITSDPIHPWVRGCGDLYSLEYFETCLARLAPGGVCCQWLPGHQLGVENLRHIVRTFCEVFPAAAVFYAGGDMVLLGSAEERIREPRELAGAAAVDLAALGLTDLAGLRMADRPRLREAAGPGPLLRDDGLILEFSAPRFVDMHALGDSLAWMEELWSTPPFPYDRILTAQRLCARGEFDRMWDVLYRASRLAPLNTFLTRHIGEMELYDAEIDALAGRAGGGLRALESARECLPGDIRIRGVEADVRLARGEYTTARQVLAKLLEESPDSTYLRRRLAAVPPSATVEEFEARCDRAVLAGMAWLDRYLDRDGDPRDVGVDRVHIFLEIGATTRNPDIRARAMAIARRVANGVTEELVGGTEPLSGGETVDLLELLASAETLGLDRADLEARARGALAAHPSFEELYGVSFEELPVLPADELFEVVMSVYSVAKAEAFLGEEFRVEPGLREVLQIVAGLPLISAKDDPTESRARFRDEAYLVTHVAYLLTDYNRLRLREADAPWLLRYLRENFGAVLKAGDVELVGEFVDVFRSQGHTEADDLDVRAGTEFLLAEQNADGSWGGWRREKNPYQAMHPTWCAVCGLRHRMFRSGTPYEKLLRRELSGD